MERQQVSGRHERCSISKLAGNLKLALTPNSIQNACVSVVCIWALMPQLAYSGVLRILSLVAVGVWLLIEVSRPRGIIRRPTLPLLALFVFVSYTLLFEFMTHGLSGIVSRIQLYIMLFFLVVQQARRNELHSLNSIFWLVIILTAVAMTTTYIFMITIDARVMRTIVRSSEAAQDLIGQGVGGYAIAYGAVLMLPVLTVLSLRPVLIDRLGAPPLLRFFPLLPRLLIWYLTGLSVLLVISSQFATAVMIFAVSTMAVLVLWRATVFRIFITIMLMLFLLFFFRALLIELLVYLAPLVEDTNYALKVNDLLISLRSDGVGGTVEDRVERYSRSLTLFLENPFTGVLYFNDVGKHSTLLDSFARWGALVGAILVYLVSFSQIRALRTLSSVPGGAGAAFGTLIAVLMVFGLNNVFMAGGIIIYIIYPLVFDVLGQTWSHPQRAGLAVPHA